MLLLLGKRIKFYFVLKPSPANQEKQIVTVLVTIGLTPDSSNKRQQIINKTIATGGLYQRSVLIGT